MRKIWWGPSGFHPNCTSFEGQWAGKSFFRTSKTVPWRGTMEMFVAHVEASHFLDGRLRKKFACHEMGGLRWEKVARSWMRRGGVARGER
jgi:hypothetical protein